MPKAGFLPAPVITCHALSQGSIAEDFLVDMFTFKILYSITCVLRGEKWNLLISSRCCPRKQKEHSLRAFPVTPD